MLINGKLVTGNSYAYEGCHKIYICENQADEEMMKSYGYDIYPLSTIEETWEKSCPLRFISNANLDKSYVEQFEYAEFE